MFAEFILAYEKNAMEWPILTALVFMGLGSLVSILFWRSKKLMSRASFFAAQNVTILLLWLLYLANVWYGDQLLSSGSWLYVTMLSEIALFLMIGFIVGGFAVERARDAFDNRYAAFLAFIPIFNLGLLLAKGEAPDDNYRFRWAANWFGAVIGFACLAVTRVLQQEPLPIDFYERIDQAYLDSPEVLFRMTAAQMQVPEQIEEGLTLVEVKADGMNIIYEFVADSDHFERLDLSPARADDIVCTHPDFQGILNLGGTIRQRYSAAGHETVELVFTDEICRF